MSAAFHRALLAIAIAITLALSSACARRAPQSGTTIAWYAGRVRPAFDPDGPPDALRVALERHLSRGLVERAADGSIVPGLADSVGSPGTELEFAL